MKYVVTINDKKYEVEVEKGQASVLSTTTVVAQAPVAVATPVAAPVAAAAPVQAVAAPTNVQGEAIKAPMPGVILDVRTAPGTAVKKGDVIMVMEAMKMENEIFAPRDGVIVQVVAAKGASVSTGDVLAAIQ